MRLDHNHALQTRHVSFDRRQIPPRACVVDNMPHVRSFLAEMLIDLGFVTHECNSTEIKSVLSNFAPDLIVIGSLGQGDEVPSLLRRVMNFGGKIVLFGGRSSPSLNRSHELGETLGLTMLPPLRTPFRDSDISEILDEFLPIASPPDIGVDVDEALTNSWVQLRYVPKIDTRSLTTLGVEAMIRVRHPVWGPVSAAYFIPAANDPCYHALSQFVIMHAMADWLRFTTDSNRIDISVSLPTPVLEDADFLGYIVRKLPENASRGRLLISVDCADIPTDAAMVQRASARLAFQNVGIAIEAVGADSAMLVGRRDLPVVEMKVQRRFVAGCSTDRVKQAVCAAIATAAHENGARSVADGVATQGDFVTLRNLGFDLVQGSLYAKPMEAHKFASSMLVRRFADVS
jgi:EAL domain-containing protein (putative c-di-GMP-specific phosphodiesterase class I)